MWYINLHTINDDYGNPTSSPAPDSLALPDELLSEYINTRGFANIQHQDGVVVAVTVNQAALDAYLKEHPDKPPEPEPVDEVKLLKAQIKAQSERSEFMEDCIAEMAGYVYV